MSGEYTALHHPLYKTRIQTDFDIPFLTEDNDPDSSMLSTPSNEDEHDSDQNLYNEDEDQDLFPSSDRPSTPKNNHLNATAPGELSPPQSQSTSQRVATEPDESVEMGGMGNGDGAGAFDSVNVSVNGTDGAGEMMGGQQNGNDKQYVPGSGWKNRKAQEDYQRAAETLVDRDFSLREFGDLFDDRAVVQQQELQQEQQPEQIQQPEQLQQQAGNGTGGEAAKQES
ncbi:hypothetical protein EPUS_08995 [Endocarpon pusillum Z07020]|uniref:Uncharacterized protein n=1 Tax=Endocarpon pusillum (strain Z07020 / HMAS-L-300199) TaxID=1263415 RepID=U1G334_ENDPU|nr:uncharacterized protein EPUS_08995 [Endocarpon pusillum Z07020]ERF71682.1 hypothetical protein EPUS_08995 [Endocarpon pusillum Z07020]